MVADPASMAAIEQGCTCPRMDNADMRGTGLFVLSGDCPLHGASSKDFTARAERTTEGSASCESEQVSNVSESDSLVSANDSGDLKSCVSDHIADTGKMVPLGQQQAMLEAQIVKTYDPIAFYHQYWAEIVAAARERHADGFVHYGSRMYSWSKYERWQNIIEELADALVYMSSGDYSTFGGNLG